MLIPDNLVSLRYIINSLTFVIAIEKTLISEDILERKFVCDLNACKGQCCVDGDSGAPLEEEEVAILAQLYDKIKPYIPAEGIKAIEKQGTSVIDSDGDFTTTLVEGSHCAYVYFEEGIAKCAIEKANMEGKIDFKKPISCHLYPIRISKTTYYESLNYHRWDICKPACKCGSKLNVPIYKFLKAPLIRKYGENWYNELEIAASLK
jgi:hypothetical protein